MDLYQMFVYDGWKYGLLVVDVFSSKVYTEPLKDKSSEATAFALQKIVKKFGTPITKIECDQEFVL